MSTRIVSRTFEDVFGNILPFYRSNVGDKVTAVIDVENSISLRSSASEIITYYEINNEYVRNSGSFNDDGFRVGDSVYLEAVFPGAGAPTFTETTTITFVSDLTIEVASSFGTDGFQYDNSPRLYIRVNRFHDAIDVQINHVPNGQEGNEFSLIDGEITTARFENLNALTVGDFTASINVGKASGQFDIGCFLQYVSLVNDVRRYQVTINTFNSGVYDDDDFIQGGCLKFYTKFQFKSINGEPYDTLDLIDSLEADTGYFDEAYNMGVVDSTVVQNIESLDYAFVTSGSFTITAPDSTQQIGGVYLSNDDEYFKNKYISQSNITMQLGSYALISPTTYLSALNESGAGYTLQVSAPVIVGSQYTYNYVFTPNSLFRDFIEDIEEGNRRFVLWIKAGSVNLRLFDGQLTKEPLVAGDIPNVDTRNVIEHNDNTTDSAIFNDEIFTYTEDDLAYVLKFAPLKGSVYNTFRQKVEAFNQMTGETFTLQEVVFDLTQSQISADGKQMIDITIGQSNNLPNTSAKRDAFLKLDPSLDTITLYGLKFYFPFINRWEYWISQSNADAQFFPNQDKNWFRYQTPSEWKIRLVSSLENDEQTFVSRFDLFIKDYDTSLDVTSTIELYRVITGQQVFDLVENETMLVRAIHTGVQGFSDVDSWGMITIEPTESNPRYILSTIIPTDFNSSNPLIPISGNVATLSFVGNDAIIECYIDVNLVNLANGVSIGSRINGTGESVLLQADGFRLLQANGSSILI